MHELTYVCCEISRTTLVDLFSKTPKLDTVFISIRFFLEYFDLFVVQWLYFILVASVILLHPTYHCGYKKQQKLLVVEKKEKDERNMLATRTIKL